MQEFVFSIQKPDVVVSLKFKEFHVIGRNKTIGTAHFELAELADGVPKKMTQKMEGGGLVLAIFCRQAFPSTGTNMIPGRVIKERLGSLRLVLEKASYYPGEVVRGFVRFFERYRKPLSIVLHFEGFSKVTWSEGSDDPTYTSVVPFFSHSFVLFGSRKHYQKVKVGPQFLFEAAFEFRLPTALPPSYSCLKVKGIFDTKLTNEYRVVGLVNRGNLQTKRFSLDFNVLTTPTPSLQGFSHSTSRKLINDGDIVLRIEGERFITAGTHPYVLKVSIDNTKGTFPIERLTIKLKVAIYYHAEKLNRSAVQTIWRITLPDALVQNDGSTDATSDASGIASIVPVPVGKKREGTLKMMFASNLIPSLSAERHSPLIQTQLYLVASVKKIMTASKSYKAVTAIPVVRQDFGEKPQNVGAPAELQCLAYSVPREHIDRLTYVPPLSFRGKKISTCLSAQYPKLFDFSELGESIDPELFTGYDPEYMQTRIYDVKPAEWTPGTLPSWLPKTWPAEIPQYLRFTMETPTTAPTASSSAAPQQIFDATSSSSSSSDSSSASDGETSGSSTEEEPMKFMSKLYPKFE